MSVKPSLPVRPARSELLAPPEASCSPRSKRVARPARSELLALLEACRSPCSKRVARPARSELLAPPEASCSPHSKCVARPARINTPMLFYASLPAAKLERTANQVKSVRPTYPVRPTIFSTPRYFFTKFSDKENLKRTGTKLCP